MIRWKLAKRPSGAAEWLSARRSVTASSSGSPSNLGRHRRYVRLVVEIVGSRRSLQANSDLFSWRCRVPRRPIRENLSNLREVIMTMSEYEERFRPPAPSLHQTFAEVRRPNRGGRRNRRLWVTAALVGVMTITSKAALHHSSHANGSQVSKSGVQACDFIYR